MTFTPQITTTSAAYKTLQQGSNYQAAMKSTAAKTWSVFKNNLPYILLFAAAITAVLTGLGMIGATGGLLIGTVLLTYPIYKVLNDLSETFDKRKITCSSTEADPPPLTTKNNCETPHSSSSFSFPPTTKPQIKLGATIRKRQTAIAGSLRDEDNITARNLPP